MWGGALLLLLVASAQGDEPGAETRFDGRYRLAINAERAQERIDDAVDEGVEGMRPLRRRIGGKRLRAKNPLVRNIQVATDDDRITIVLDDDRYEAPRDGRRIETRLDDGEKVRLSHSLRGPRLVQVFYGDDGVRTNTFSLGGQGQRMVMAVEITSDQLGGPVRYRIPYRRH
jgi:hypothetical protein